MPPRDQHYDVRRLIVWHIFTLLQTLLGLLAELLYSGIRRDPIPYHTSSLSGETWVQELLKGHPGRIRCELGMYKEDFIRLIEELRAMGYRDSKFVTLEEQLSIFMYTCVTGLTIRHVAERFQRSNDTVSRYFKKMLFIFSNRPFYSTHVQFPTNEPVHPKIRRNPKFWPYFRNSIGAIDGCHIPVSPPAIIRSNYRNRKGFLSQNGLFICDFGLKFVYTLTGWEGSATDARVYGDAISTNLRIPPGKYLLADAGYPSRRGLLVPYRGVRYHLAEWGRANTRPSTKEELFNLRHASARNVIERIFGILKRQFRILLLAPEYDLDVQARIPAALCALHNFIYSGDRNEEDELDSTLDADEDPDECQLWPGTPIGPQVAAGSATGADDLSASRLRDDIAVAMWNDYQAVLEERAQRNEMGTVSDIESDFLEEVASVL